MMPKWQFLTSLKELPMYFGICRQRKMPKKWLTGKTFSEAFILASTNPQYDKKLFIELQVQYMKITSSEHGENMGRTCCLHVLPMF